MEKIIKTVLISLIFAVLIQSVIADGDNYYRYKVLSVYDGDTLTVDMHEIPRGFNKQKLRLAGVDTPEIRGKCEYEKLLAREARDFIRSQVAKAKDIKFKVIDQGVYGRYIVHLYIDNVNINEKLIEYGYARRYDGKTARKGWCDGR